MNFNSTNKLYGLFLITVFLVTLNEIDSAKKQSLQSKKPACFNAPIFVYDEERKKYYRQDWCKDGKKQPVYFDTIPIPVQIIEKAIA